MVAPPSTPLSNISLLFIADLIMKSDEAILNLPNSVPPSFNRMSVPSASRTISPPASTVKSAAVDTLGIAASLPLTINFFQLGVYFISLWLVTFSAHFLVATQGQ